MKNVVNQLVEGLKGLGFDASIPTAPCKTNGESWYIYATHPYLLKDGSNTFKFRVSDHDCGDYRMFTEYCIREASQIEKILTHFEKQISPEKFITRVVESTFTFEVKKYKKSPTCISEKFFTSKKGKEMVLATWAQVVVTDVRK